MKIRNNQCFKYKADSEKEYGKFFRIQNINEYDNYFVILYSKIEFTSSSYYTSITNPERMVGKDSCYEFSWYYKPVEISNEEFEKVKLEALENVFNLKYENPK